MNKTNYLASIALCFVCVGAAGQSVEDRKAVLDAKTDLVRKEKDLNDALRALAGATAKSLPLVVSVTIGTERIARLQLGNGIVGHYREGEAVQSGVVVTAISPKQVFVAVSSANSKKAVAIPLEFAGPVFGGNTAATTVQSVPDALLPAAPSVNVPAIEVIPTSKPSAPIPTKAGK